MRLLNYAEARVLVLYANYTTKLSYFDDWLDAFTEHPLLRVVSVDICRRGAKALIRREIPEVDFIVLLHSTSGDTTMYLEPLVGVLNERAVPLVAFVGNEVNIVGSPIASKRETLRQLHPEYIATQLLLEAGEFLWGDLVTKAVLAIPHALNPKAFKATKATQQRSIDIGVRSVRYHPSLGDTDRNDLYDLFSSPTVTDHLAVDISTERLNRRAWAEFLNTSRATVSTEAGSWYLERDDSTVREIRALALKAHRRTLVLNSSGLVRRIGHKVPSNLRLKVRALLSRGPLRLDDNLIEELPPDEVLGLFARLPRPGFYSKCISSRHFDAVGTMTTQVLLEGRYNDLLEPNVHYLELKRDRSNLNTVLETLADRHYCEEIATSAQVHVLAKHTYSGRIAELITVLSVRDQ